MWKLINLEDLIAEEDISDLPIFSKYFYSKILYYDYINWILHCAYREHGIKSLVNIGRNDHDFILVQEDNEDNLISLISYYVNTNKLPEITTAIYETLASLEPAPTFVEFQYEEFSKDISLQIRSIKTELTSPILSIPSKIVSSVNDISTEFDAYLGCSSFCTNPSSKLVDIDLTVHLIGKVPKLGILNNKLSYTLYTKRNNYDYSN